MDTGEIKSILLKLAFYQTDEEARGMKVLHPAVGDEMGALQQKTLTSFGLPHTAFFLKLVTFKRIPSEAELDRRMDSLRAAATEYLLSSPL